MFSSELAMNFCCLENKTKKVKEIGPVEEKKRNVLTQLNSVDDDGHRWTRSSVGRPAIGDQLQHRARHIARHHIVIQQRLWWGERNTTHNVSFVWRINSIIRTRKLRSTMSFCS
jgi:hypothetical protein